ncbi:MAG: ABC transporter ATP-binding protein [Rhodospirillaceae bacterium]|nr:ABC transporter ATP-binding protein [Rhodospirillaceae bacterium]
MPAADDSSALLEVRNLQVDFRTRNGIAHVLDGIEFSLSKGEILGIVGESGCGKSMTALAIMGLVPTPPGRIAGGEIVYRGENLLKASKERMRRIRGNRISMIFQEPMTALNPVFTVGDQIAESIVLHQGLSRRAALDRAVELLREVHIPAPERRIGEFPHQLSGGMRQRIMIAIALACEPDILIADEPTTALDVTVQAQVFDLLLELQQDRDMAIVLITHDMGVIAEMTGRVLVMYAGRIIEAAAVDDLLENPQHPYTSGLIACVPQLSDEPEAEREALMEIPGVVPPLTELGVGCAFEPRCGFRMPVCVQSRPSPVAVGAGHSAACWLMEDADRQDGDRQGGDGP